MATVTYKNPKRKMTMTQMLKIIKMYKEEKKKKEEEEKKNDRES